MVAPIASATPNLQKGHVPNKGKKGKNCNKALANFFQQPFDFPIGGHFPLISYALRGRTWQLRSWILGNETVRLLYTVPLQIWPALIAHDVQQEASQYTHYQANVDAHVQRDDHISQQGGLVACQMSKETPIYPSDDTCCHVLIFCGSFWRQHSGSKFGFQGKLLQSKHLCEESHGQKRYTDGSKKGHQGTRHHLASTTVIRGFVIPFTILEKDWIFWDSLHCLVKSGIDVWLFEYL